MSKMGQYVFEMQEYDEQLIANYDLSYAKAKELFVQKYKGAGFLFDQLYRDATGIEMER